MRAETLGRIHLSSHKTQETTFPNLLITQKSQYWYSRSQPLPLLICLFFFINTENVSSAQRRVKEILKVFPMPHLGLMLLFLFLLLFFSLLFFPGFLSSKTNIQDMVCRFWLLLAFLPNSAFGLSSLLWSCHLSFPISWRVDFLPTTYTISGLKQTELLNAKAGVLFLLAYLCPLLFYVFPIGNPRGKLHQPCHLRRQTIRYI